MTPNKERIRLWVEDLRTPGLKQIVGHLEDANGYCCLGRAVRVAMANGLNVHTYDKNGLMHFDGNDADLPITVRNWYGFISQNPILARADGTTDYAACLNDKDRLGFAEIADAIERTFLAEAE